MRVDVHRLARHAPRDALVDHVDRAADRRAAVEQHRRPAQHLDPVGGQRVDRHRVVGRDVRGVDRADPVDQHAHPVARRSRAAPGARRRARSCVAETPGILREHLADLAVEIALQLGAFHHRGPGEHVEPLEAARGDVDRAVEVVVVGRGGASASGAGGGGGSSCAKAGVERARLVAARSAKRNGSMMAGAA